MRLYLSFLLIFSIILISNAQDNTISEQIKTERDIELNSLQNDLVNNKIKITNLTEQLSLLSKKEYGQKIELQEQIQRELDNRIKILEESPKVKIKSNGQLAFAELIKIQKDIQPAKLYLASNGFYTKLGKFDNLQNYSEFTSWKKEYDSWYQKKKGKNTTFDYIDKTIALITDSSNEIPLFGSISQTVTSGITLILSNLKSRDENLMSKTPQVLTLLNSIGQFESEKSILDNEWKTIDGELKELQSEYKTLVDEQITFYDIDKAKYNLFLSATLDSDISKFKVYSREKVLKKLQFLDNGNNQNWMGKVETYMHQVQSIRIRFGQLTGRMLDNIEKYEKLFSKYTDPNKFSSEFVTKAQDLGTDLKQVKENFILQFKPNKYIEDSAVMYIKR
ncbi:hypothetical protein [Polaribacter sargassicola]|uniref:hypothetical protein n=1 Tax=Polaribacter sargassicola TaxID=2836891 RepID=UPI001F30750A|nr:hypothetical protein [Polaribacter sp. DS7-9]MCG1037556.1 hypothetical protein [Polaribacter sp. DS7-9]